MEEQQLDLKDFEFGFGHSLGEVSAATIAEAFKLSDAVKLSRERSVIMQKYCPPELGKMIVCTASAEKIGDLIYKYEQMTLGTPFADQILTIGGINSYTSTSLTGHREKVEDFVEFLRIEDETIKTMDVQISVAGHCNIMSEAAKEYLHLLENTEMQDPKIPILS